MYNVYYVITIFGQGRRNNYNNTCIYERVQDVFKIGKYYGTSVVKMCAVNDLKSKNG